MHKLSSAMCLLGLLASTAMARPEADPAEHRDRTFAKRPGSGDYTSQYILRADGSLFRQIGATLCQLTNHVEDVRIPTRRDDTTAMYVVRGGGLYALPPLRDLPREGACPRADLTPLVAQLDRAEDFKWTYQLVANPSTPITMIAQDGDGRVTAWDARGLAVSVEGPASLQMNPCFGTSKSFGSYVAFVQDATGQVVKIGGRDPRKTKVDPKRYASFDRFVTSNNVCR